VLASYWYSKTYDEYITDPDTQFLLCLEAYVDKTAKNAGLTSYAGEPFLVSALHLKKPLREHSSAWFVQVYLPDLESGSSAKKKQYSHRYLTRGKSNHNYHKIMDAVLEGILTTQKKGGFKAFVWMGNVIRLMTVIPVITFVKGALIQIIRMRVHGKIGLTYHLGKMSKVCSKWFHPGYCCSLSITLLMTMESIVMKSELLCKHAITKWVAIALGGYVWKRHTYAAAGSYP
jgi:hypothetical protein